MEERDDLQFSHLLLSGIGLLLMSVKSTTMNISLFLTLAFASRSVTHAYCPVVICPGFGNDMIDYDEPLQQPREVGLRSVLARRGFDPDLILTVPVKRSDWIRVAGGLFDIPDFYTGNAKATGLGYGWYIKRLKETVDQAYEQSGGDKVILLAHSAGGWLARAAMADGTWCDEQGITTSERIRCLATMGAIHEEPMDPSTCVTRGALKNTNAMYPGAFLKDSGISYVSIGGAAIVGDNAKDQDPKTDVDELYSNRGEGSSSRVSYTSYEAVCGKGDVIGDGVVPFDWSQLQGSRKIKLDGVLHSINEVGTTLPTDRWYGSEKIIDSWLPAVLEEAELANDEKSNEFSPLAGIQEWVTNILIPSDPSR
jgi:pimeloyl-ACP methyl ester carboxylesterase